MGLTITSTPRADDHAVDPALRYLVLGLGITGLSVVKYLVENHAQVAVADSREAPPGLEKLRDLYPDVAVFTGAFPEDLAVHADCLVVSPGISVRERTVAAARQKGTEIVGDIELFARKVRKPVVGITGTNGKSTVTTLLGDMAREAGLRVKIGGNLGAPALDLIDDESTDLYVLELSSFQLETTYSLTTAAATVVNLSRDHMDRYDSFDDYVAAKASLLTGTRQRIGNRDDKKAYALGADVSFGLDAPSEGQWGLIPLDESVWLAKGDLPVMPALEMRVPGRHNLANALAAMALADAVHIPVEAMRRALRSFTGLEHRTEWVGEFAGVTWFNDSKGTNVGATVAAIEGMPGPLIIVLGGDGKGADFRPLVDALGPSIKGVVLFGRDAPLIAELLSDAVPTRTATTLKETVETARDWASEGDSVLFSPACASFDMFDNYAKRGELFKQTVLEVCA